MKEDKQKTEIRFCPRCGSTNIYYGSGLPQIWSIWECRNCGYRGPLIVEDGELATKLREDWKRNHESDSHSGTEDGVSKSQEDFSEEESEDIGASEDGLKPEDGDDPGF